MSTVLPAFLPIRELLTEFQHEKDVLILTLWLGPGLLAVFGGFVWGLI